MAAKLKVGVLVSGSGSNLQALLDAAPRLGSYEVAVVVSNVPDAFALERARKAGVPAVAVASKGRAREEHEADVTRALEAHGVGFVALAGYMRVLTPAFVRRWRGRLVNVHPALLPAFPGAHGARDALAYGAKITGCTFHLVDEEVDHGPVVLQVAVPVLPDDTEETLQKRIQAEEHRHYPLVLDWFARGLVEPRGRTVVLRGAAARGALASPDPESVGG